MRWYLIYLGPRHEVTVGTANGLLSFDSKDWLIGKYLYVRGEHEEREAREAINLLRREGYLDASGETLLNVGANIGMTCIGLVKAGYFRRAIAFEPAPNTYRLLAHNVDQNGLGEKILHFPFALSSRSGTLRLEISEDNSGDNRIRFASQGGFFQEERRQTIEVPAKTLDHMFVEYPGLREERIDLVWADIQGHEGHFFRGAATLLESGVPVVCEFWPYAILRSGISESEFQEIVSGFFTHFYLLSEEPPVSRPTSELPTLFKEYCGPRQPCLLAWVHATRGKRPWRSKTPSRN
jgi:FkbM family methyltransferase